MDRNQVTKSQEIKPRKVKPNKAEEREHLTLEVEVLEERIAPAADYFLSFGTVGITAEHS